MTSTTDRLEENQIYCTCFTCNCTLARTCIRKERDGDKSHGCLSTFGDRGN